MILSQREFDEIKKRYNTLLIMDDDADDAFCFVCDILRAEYKAALLKCGYAVNTLRRLKEAEETVWSVRGECHNGVFNEEG